MHISTMAALALLSGASAQVSTVSLFLVNFDKQPLVGSIIASDAAATTYTIGCRDKNSTDCGCPPNFTFTQGPSTMQYSFTESYNPTETDIFEIGCVITSSSVAACTNTRHAHAGTMSTVITSTSTLSGEDLGLQPVTITAAPYPPGTASTTSATSTSQSSSSSSSSQSSSASPSPTSSSSSGKTTSSSGSGSAASGKSSSSSGAAPMVTGKAQWAVGGAAAILALAAL